MAAGSPGLTRRTLIVGVLLLGGAGRTTAAPAASLPELARSLEAAWQARDLQRYLGLWSFATREQTAEESRFASESFLAERSELRVALPVEAPPEAERVGLSAQSASIREPRGRVDQWVFVARRAPGGWSVIERQPAGQFEGLVHLSLDPQGYRADGLTLRLVDFELRISRGTLFMSPENLGPTVLVFVGEGVARVAPRPATEREQLRHFCGQPVLEETVRAAYVRIHPADLHRVLQPARFEVDPESGRRLGAARQVYEQHAFRSFVLDAALPGAPWWLLPGVGDALVTFETARRGTLTYALSSSEAEDVTLFDRGRRLQILLYPSEGRTTRYNEDEGRAYDVVGHEIDARFEPERLGLEGQDTLRLRLLAAVSTIRLRLHEDMQVRSVRSPQIGDHLFFRVRGQDTLIVALGPLSGQIGVFSLTVRYGGTHSPRPLEHELQIGGPNEADVGYVLEPSLVYSNQTAWYPRAPVDSYSHAVLRLDVPAGYMAVTGGSRSWERVQNGRYQVEYRLDRPGRYYSVVVARLQEAGRAEAAGVELRAFGQGRTRGEAVRLLARADDALRFYAAAFGPCPYPQLNIVVVEGRTPGGHSPPGMIVFSTRPAFVRDPLRDDPASFSDVPGFFFAHEVAHQWWGHGVSGQNYRERWLSEGLAQYAAALWARHHYGERVFQEVLARFGRWALRKTGEGPIHLGQRLGHLQEDPQVFRAVVYDKGAYVLHMLRQLVGGEPFLESLRAFQEAFRYHKAGSDDLRVALEKRSGLALAPYFDEWVYGTRLPELDVSHRTTGAGSSFQTIVEVRATGLPGPVPLALSVTHEAGQVTEIVSLSPAGGRFTIDTPGRPRKVQANADRALLARVRQ